MQLPYRHYIGEHCVKRLSNYDKNSGRTSVLNVDVTNRLPMATFL